MTGKLVHLKSDTVIRMNLSSLFLSVHHCLQKGSLTSQTLYPEKEFPSCSSGKGSDYQKGMVSYLWGDTIYSL